MVSLKVVVFIGLLAVALAVPQPNTGKGLGFVSKKQGGGLFGALDFLGRGISEAVSNVGDVITDLLNLRPSGVFDDGIQLVITLTRAIGGIINSLIPGLGSLLGNLVIAILKSIICALGSPGLLGNLFGGAPGLANTKDIPAICDRNYGTKWGYKGFSSNKYTVDLIFKHYNCNNAEAQIKKYINTYTKGRGLASVDVNIRVILQNILNIGIFVDSGSDNWNQKTFVNFLTSVITVCGGIGNNYKYGLGDQVVDEMTTYINITFGNSGKAVIAQKPEINQKVNNCKPFKWTVTFSQDDDSSDNDSGNNSNVSGNDNKGSGNDNKGSGNNNNNNGSDNDNKGSGNDNKGSGNDNKGSGNDNKGSGNDNKGSDNDNKGSGNNNKNNGSGNDNKGSGNDNEGSDKDNKGSGNDNKGSGNNNNNNNGSGKDNKGSGNNNDNNGSDNNSSSNTTNNSDKNNQSSNTNNNNSNNNVSYQFDGYSNDGSIIITVNGKKCTCP